MRYGQMLVGVASVAVCPCVTIACLGQLCLCIRPNTAAIQTGLFIRRDIPVFNLVSHWPVSGRLLLPIYDRMNIRKKATNKNRLYRKNWINFTWVTLLAI